MSRNGKGWWYRWSGAFFLSKNKFRGLKFVRPSVPSVPPVPERKRREEKK
jgi:hypothetical protein